MSQTWLKKAHGTNVFVSWPTCDAPSCVSLSCAPRRPSRSFCLVCSWHCTPVNKKWFITRVYCSYARSIVFFRTVCCLACPPPCRWTFLRPPLTLACLCPPPCNFQASD
ncbi:unnamed protein product, partial [Ectocarpus sp. 8 AP-2014]